MGKIKLILAIAVLLLLVVGGLQIIPPVLANYQLQDDLHDVAALGGARIGLLPPKTDDELRSEVVRRAAEHNIQLDPGQVIVRHGGVSGGPSVYLEADYKVTVHMPGYSFDVHFEPSSNGNKGF